MGNGVGISIGISGIQAKNDIVVIIIIKIVIFQF